MICLLFPHTEVVFLLLFSCRKTRLCELYAKVLGSEEALHVSTKSLEKVPFGQGTCHGSNCSLTRGVERFWQTLGWGLTVRIRTSFMNINETLKDVSVDISWSSSMGGILSACHHKPHLLSHVTGLFSLLVHIVSSLLLVAKIHCCTCWVVFLLPFPCLLFPVEANDCWVLCDLTLRLCD